MAKRKPRPPLPPEEQEVVDQIGWFIEILLARQKGKKREEREAYHQLKLMGITVHFQADERKKTSDQKS